MPYCTKCGTWVSTEGVRCFSCQAGGLFGGLFVLALMVLAVAACCCAGIGKMFERPIPPVQQPPATEDKIFVNKASIGKVLDASDKIKRQVCALNLWHPINESQDQRWYLREIAGSG